MKVGVTGGCGFIGTYVCEELAQRGHEPVAFDRQRRASAPPWEVMLGDVRDATAMVELAAHCDAVVHLAAVLGTQETISNPRPAAEINVLGGLNFLEAVAQYDLPGVYICVGNHTMNNSYSITKTTIERFVRMYNAERATRISSVRVVNAYGPRQLAAAPFGSSKVRKITPAVVCRALSGMPVELYGGGHQVSDMVWVGDVARALVSALETVAAGQVVDVVEVGPTRSATIRQLAEIAIGLAVDRGFDPVPIVDLPMRPGEDPKTPVTADAETLRAIGIDPGSLRSLSDGLADTVDWFIKTEGEHWTAPNGLRRAG
ncbi:NAD-dependent epimerase/dehydratase family protein [Micromonospora carbonacea]|uniref:NAD-dependent epimerase/dehydratase family protein n=1 Tax=Micromonospora carbonacea TaxID=47853 RepID=A0A7H8XT46_9ACTN|nr:NAD-dependent epimerase/dehydratase family protein [Micromonospora carbonacea]MBB5830126.1 nucleoside-diphosphate-sugar epimerase [Micromonospora carbonacea]QLD27955.1 NAD-dependent epimerase/dehydratase family protein [Micromonospora carbonacea]